MNTNSAFRHESGPSEKYEWLTPPNIINALGPFDLDPRSPVKRPWPTAEHHLTKEDDGLLLPWFGMVWLNPPYGNASLPWMRKMLQHGNGIALTFARTDTTVFHECVFGRAAGLLWLKGRLNFYSTNGKRAGNAGSPSVLIAYGTWALKRLEKCNLEGHITHA